MSAIMRLMKVASGLDELLRHIPASWKQQRIGVICHQASVDAQLNHILDRFLAHNLHVTAIFGPEHGLYGTAQDQIEVPSDIRHNIPIYSLYAETRYPPKVWLDSVDLLVCDLQDVGSRYYTFIWTMALALQACAKYGKKFVVIDRPNPINGESLEGPVLDPHFASFVGLYPIPVRHGMTIGEIALWLNEGWGIGADLDIIPMKGWTRSMYFDQTGLPWVIPSPNMPTLDTALIYPGACLLEGTTLSEGRGTTRPFEILGAPYIHEHQLAETLNAQKLPGIEFRACRFEPTFHKYQGQSCGGVQQHVTDRRRLRSFLTGLVVIETIRSLYPKAFGWRPPPYEYETEKLPFDILCGTDTIRLAMENGRSARRLDPAWTLPLREFSRQQKPFLLYN